MRTKPADDTTEAILLACLPRVRSVFDFVRANTAGPLEASLLCELVRDMFLYDLSAELRAAVLAARKDIVPVMVKAFGEAARLHEESKKNGQARTDTTEPGKKSSV